MLDKNSNGLDLIITQALEELKEEQGENFSLKDLNCEKRLGKPKMKFIVWSCNVYKM